MSTKFRTQLKLSNQPAIQMMTKNASVSSSTDSGVFSLCSSSNYETKLNDLIGNTNKSYKLNAQNNVVREKCEIGNCELNDGFERLMKIAEATLNRIKNGKFVCQLIMTNLKRYQN